MLNRAQRLQASTKEVENLYYRHAAIDRLTTGDRQIVSAPSNAKPRIFDDKDVGIPLSKEVLEGRIPRSPNQERPQNVRLVTVENKEGSLDARHLAARSYQRPAEGRFTIARTGAIDARTFGARPRVTREQMAFGRSNGNTRSPRQDKIGLDEKQRFSSPRQGSEYKQDQRYRDVRPTRPNVDRERRTSSLQSGAPSSRTRRPRASGSDKDGEPRRRKRDKQTFGGSSFSDSKDKEPVWNAEEDEYLEQKRKGNTVQIVDFQPGDVTQDTFSGVRPAVVSGEWGMSELVGERLILAKKHLAGEYIQWESKEQRADVLTLVERLNGINNKATNDGEGGEQSPPTEAEQHTQTLLGKLLGGKYIFSQPPQGRDILGHVARHTDRNETYFPDDQRSLLEKIKTLMPQHNTRTSGKSIKPEAKP